MYQVGNMEEKLKDLNLLLIYLSGWEEDSRKNPGEKLYRSWKGYLFEVLKTLQDEDLIVQFPKSLILTEKGLTKARRLKAQYF
jgi:hypothetical protein